MTNSGNHSQNRPTTATRRTTSKSELQTERSARFQGKIDRFVVFALYFSSVWLCYNTNSSSEQRGQEDREAGDFDSIPTSPSLSESTSSSQMSPEISNSDKENSSSADMRVRKRKSDADSKESKKKKKTTTKKKHTGRNASAAAPLAIYVRGDSSNAALSASAREAGHPVVERRAKVHSEVHGIGAASTTVAIVLDEDRSSDT